MSHAVDTTKRVRGAELARTRKGHRIHDTRDKVAVAAGINSKSVQRAEMGKASFETLEAICYALGVSPWDYWIPLDESLARPESTPAEAARDSIDEAFLREFEQQGEAIDQLREGHEQPPWFAQAFAQLQAELKGVNEKLVVLRATK